MASKISPTLPPKFSAFPVSASRNNGYSDYRLSETECAQVEALLFPQSGYHYCYEKITPYTRLTLMEFTFDLKLFFQILSEQLALKGMKVEKICIAKEAARGVLISPTSMPDVLDLEVQLAGVSSSSEVDFAILSTLQEMAHRATKKPVVYEFFKDNGLQQPYAAAVENGCTFTVPAKAEGSARPLRFRVGGGVKDSCISSIDCLQIEVTSSLLGGKQPLHASAAPGYDYQRAHSLAVKKQFEILPEKAPLLFHGAFEYARLLQGGYKPASMKPEIGLWEGFVKQYLTGEAKEKLGSTMEVYIDEHYRNNPRSALFFLLNLEAFVSRAPEGEEKNLVRIVVAEKLARCLKIASPINTELFLAHCKVHLFLANLQQAGPSKFYYDHTHDPVYHICAQQEDCLFTRFPIDAVITLFSRWEECQVNQAALEQAFPLSVEAYSQRFRAHLATLSKTDYPPYAESREILSAVCGAESVDRARFLEGLLRKVKILKKSEERSRLIDKDLAVFNHFHKGPPLTLEKVKTCKSGYEEAMIEEFALSEDPVYLAFALRLAGIVLAHKRYTPALLTLLQNPLALCDPQLRTHYETLCSLQKEAEDPAAHLSLFLLYYDPESAGKMAQKEGKHFERLLSLQDRKTFSALDKEKIGALSLSLIPLLLQKDLKLAHRLLVLLTQDPPLVDEAAREALILHVIPRMLSLADKATFDSGSEFLRAKIEEARISPAGAAQCLAHVLSTTKDVSRFKEIVGWIGELEEIYFAAQSENISIGIDRARSLFTDCLSEVMDLARGVSLDKQTEWMKGVVKLKTKNAFACCTKALVEKKILSCLEEDAAFWLHYISSAVSFTPPQAVTLFLEKEELLLQKLDMNAYAQLFIAVFPLLSLEVQGEEKRFLTIFAKMDKGISFEKKGEVFQLFTQRFHAGCSSALALQALVALNTIAIKNLKTEKGISLFSRAAEIVPADEAVVQEVTALFKKMRESGAATDGHLYQSLTKSVLSSLYKEKTERTVREALSILQFALTNHVFSEERFYRQLSPVLEASEECWTPENVQLLHRLLLTGTAAWKNSAEEPFLALITPLFAILTKKLERYSEKKECEQHITPWSRFIEELLKKCHSSKKRTISRIATQEILLHSALAKKWLKLGEPASAELARAEQCFVKASQEALFSQLSHQESSFSALVEVMLSDPSARLRILSLMKPYNFKGPTYLRLMTQMSQLYVASPDPLIFKEMYQIGLFLSLHPDLTKSLNGEQSLMLTEVAQFLLRMQTSNWVTASTGVEEMLARIPKALELLANESSKESVKDLDSQLEDNK